MTLSGFVLLMAAALLILPVAQMQSGPATAALARQKVQPRAFDDTEYRYSSTAALGAVEELRQRINGGEHSLAAGEFGYLLGVLDALEVPRSSQILAFSKTSADRDPISPQTPRAIYFNDEVYVAWTAGTPRIEIAAVDPRLGAVFYTLEPKPHAPLRVQRNDRCLECHTSTKNLGVPGFLARSVITDEKGSADWRRGVSHVTHRTPLGQRWGGWYVCGSHGGQTHLGNLRGEADLARQSRETNFRGNLANLSDLFDTSRYPEPTSDIVALMVFEHQCHMHNFIARLRQDARSVLDQNGTIEENAELKGVADAFLKYLLFADEAPLAAPIQGVSDFTRWFESQGPRDSRGRSLREFDLKTRLFKYPCSYLIHSSAFDSLPQPMRRHLYRRLWAILNGEDPDPMFGKLTPETRQAVREILIDTKPSVPRYWSL